MEIAITKHIFSGDGFDNNIGYKIVDNESGYGFFLPTCNNFDEYQYDEHYNDRVIEEGIQLYDEALPFLKYDNFLEDCASFEDAILKTIAAGENFLTINLTKEELDGLSDAQE